MRINNIIIKNFRCYYGENKVDFNRDGKITLIWGDSGYGKSSFLQFFRWILYNNPDFGIGNDKPLFNLSAYKEMGKDDYLEVKGVVEFEHAGIKYSLDKSIYYTYALNPDNAKIYKTDFTLQYLDQNNWTLFTGDISKKINSIMPKGLSKYFLLDGEKAREIVLNSVDLRIAINALFGIDAYGNAIEHIGTAYKKKSVISYYSNLMASQIKNVSGVGTGMSAEEFQDNLEQLNEEIENLKNLRRGLVSNISQYSIRRDEILKVLGEASNKSNIEEIIKRNEEDIKRKEKEIDVNKTKIGNLFYRNYPYILMAKVTSKSAKVLREKQESFTLNYHNVFENLKKNLLNEILEKGTCVCGRELDSESRKHIEEITATMPPNSYSFQFAQFVKKSRSETQAANMNIYDYDNIKSDIASLQSDIAKIEEDNKERINVLKKLNDAKDLVDELEQIEHEIKKCNFQKQKFDGDIAKKKQVFDIGEQQLKKIISNAEISNKYKGVILFFKVIHDELEKEKADREVEVATVLNECVREVFKKLTTQRELDVDKIEFVNKNFSLRTTFLSGGQYAIDEYSYVIGIIKALQKFGMDNNENPIIVDAPFAFTGNEQSEHIFRTLPKVVKQTILLTLDCNKIKDIILNEKNLYELYVIKNESQEKATIERGTVSDIKF